MSQARAVLCTSFDGRGTKIRSKEIPADKDGYRQYFAEWTKKAVYVAVEAGGHIRWIHDTITQLGINVYNTCQGQLWRHKIAETAIICA